MPLALIGVDSSAGDDGMSPVERRLSDLEDTMQRVQQQQQVQRMQLRVLFHPEQLVAFANQAAVAIGVSNTRYGSGIILTAQGHISTAHHVLLDCGWNEDSPSLVQVGREAKIVWSHEAEVLKNSDKPSAAWIAMKLSHRAPVLFSPTSALFPTLRRAQRAALLSHVQQSMR